MTYKDAVTEEMEWLAKKKDTIFIGEGVINAGRIHGTLENVSIKKCIEMPLAENLIVGCAMGLSLRNYRPIVIFNFMDFMLPATDALIHHLASIPKLSGNKVKLPVIIRAIIGRQGNKFEIGCQHDNDFTYIYKPYIHCETFRHGIYEDLYRSDFPVIITEKINDYEKPIITR